eukprot:1183308-Prorocentrum_minimum.AAC.3
MSVEKVMVSGASCLLPRTSSNSSSAVRHCPPAAVHPRRVDLRGCGVDLKGCGVDLKGCGVDLKGCGVDLKGCGVDLKGF